MPGLSGFRRGLVSICSGTSLQPTRGMSSQWFNASRAICSSVCFFKPMGKNGHHHPLKHSLGAENTECFSWTAWGSLWTGLGTTGINYKRVTIFILDLSGSQEDPVSHLHASPRAIHGRIQLVVFAQLTQNVGRFHGVPPYIISMTTPKKKASFTQWNGNIQTKQT